MRYLIPLLFSVLAIIHILPALSGVSVDRVADLYGVPAEDKMLMTLLQHRAVLFGLVAGACIYAANRPSARWPVLWGAIISMSSFIFIAMPRGQLSGPLAKIAYVDGFGLIIAAILVVLLMRT